MIVPGNAGEVGAWFCVPGRPPDEERMASSSASGDGGSEAQRCAELRLFLERCASWFSRTGGGGEASGSINTRSSLVLPVTAHR